MKQVLFRADDLGYSEGVNLGIAKSVKEGLIKSVGLMSNMVCAKQGVQFLKDTNVSLGLHCNISAGRPLSPCIQVSSLVDEEGNFKKSAVYRNSGCDIVKIEEARIEIEAQYQKFISLTGKKPSYMDGHAVASMHFFEAIQLVAKKYNVVYSSFPIREQEPIQIGNKAVYMHAGSSLEMNPIATLHAIVDHMSEDECHMIVYHPGFIDAYILENSSLVNNRAIETQALCEETTRAYMNAQKILQICYDDLT